MFPQLAVSVWLTLVWMGVLIGLADNNSPDEIIPSMLISTVFTSIPVIALYYSGFWIIN